MSWQPLLEGALKDRAWESVQAIVKDLETGHSAGDASLAGGTAGLAVFHAYLAQTERGQDQAAIAGLCLERAVAAMADNPTWASLYGGLTGVGWALAHLQGRISGLDGEQDLAEIDDVLLNHLDQSPWGDDYDLISGLVGFGVYALERLPRPAAAACLERVIDRLAETAEYRPEGTTWWTNPAWVIPETREKYPSGYYNLGLAHGVPGIIALLGQACAAGEFVVPPLGGSTPPTGATTNSRATAVGDCATTVEKARPLLEQAVRWLLAQQGPGGFDSWIVRGVAKGTARLAWCYGDPGVAATLLWAARCVDEPDWEREARSTGRAVRCLA